LLPKRSRRISAQAATHIPTTKLGSSALLLDWLAPGERTVLRRRRCPCPCPWGAADSPPSPLNMDDRWRRCIDCAEIFVCGMQRPRSRSSEKRSKASRVELVSCGLWVAVVALWSGDTTPERDRVPPLQRRRCSSAQGTVVSASLPAAAAGGSWPYLVARI
jgi:hypothetical protein